MKPTVPHHVPPWKSQTIVSIAIEDDREPRTSCASTRRGGGS